MSNRPSTPFNTTPRRPMDRGDMSVPGRKATLAIDLNYSPRPGIVICSHRATVETASPAQTGVTQDCGRLHYDSPSGQQASGRASARVAVEKHVISRSHVLARVQPRGPDTLTLNAIGLLRTSRSVTASPKPYLPTHFAHYQSTCVRRLPLRPPRPLVTGGMSEES